MRPGPRSIPQRGPISGSGQAADTERLLLRSTEPALVQQAGSSGGGGVNGPQYGPTALNKWAESKLKWLASPRSVKAAWYIVGPDLEARDECHEREGRSTACVSALGDLPTFKPLKALSFVSKWFKGKKKSDRAKDAKKEVNCPQCFLAGTDVLMADGSTADIEDVDIGDKVLATDPKTGKTEPHRVTHLIRTEADKKFNKLSIATDQAIESLTATHEHPFWSPSEKDWIPARGLKPGMTLRTDKGDSVIVTANKPFTMHARTYNLTVEGLHTYYVLAGETSARELGLSPIEAIYVASRVLGLSLPQVKTAIYASTAWHDQQEDWQRLQSGLDE
ncbi:hypothetical protein HUT18_00005 [Streptomyces sp. NA04227]|nr:hypothetical protein HUT18_00005 [Streptomyces sp. NA04227]